MNTALTDTTVNNPKLVTPALMLDFEQISQTYDRFMDSFPGGEIFYAAKDNAMFFSIIALTKGVGRPVQESFRMYLQIQAGIRVI